MQPVVVNPKISFTQLAQELATVTSDEARRAGARSVRRQAAAQESAT